MVSWLMHPHVLGAWRNGSIGGTELMRFLWLSTKIWCIFDKTFIANADPSIVLAHAVRYIQLTLFIR